MKPVTAFRAQAGSGSPSCALTLPRQPVFLGWGGGTGVIHPDPRQKRPVSQRWGLGGAREGQSRPPRPVLRAGVGGTAVL